MSMYQSQDGHAPAQTVMELPTSLVQEEQVSEIYSPTREERMEMETSLGAETAEAGGVGKVDKWSELSYYEQNLRPKPLQPRSGASSVYGDM